MAAMAGSLRRMLHLSLIGCVGLGVTHRLLGFVLQPQLQQPRPWWGTEGSLALRALGGGVGPDTLSGEAARLVSSRVRGTSFLLPNRWCDMANLAGVESKAGQSGQDIAKMTPASVEEMHRAFVDAEEGAVAKLDAWKRLCDILSDTAQIQGCINTPLRDTGERAMHRAAELGRVQNLRWLVRNGANVNAATAPAYELSPKGDSSLALCPAHVAAAYGQIEALEALEIAGADLNCRRPDGATPLDFAVDAGQNEAVAWLTKRGVASGLS